MVVKNHVHAAGFCPSLYSNKSQVKYCGEMYLVGLQHADGGEE